MNVLVTGATGFTGSRVLPMLLDRGYSVRCLIRPSSRRSSLPTDSVECVVGDLGDLQSLQQAMRGADMLVNVASLGFGHAPIIVQAALANRIKRAVFISTTAIFTSLNASSKKIRLAAEKEIRESGLACTILRPTMIYGSSRDRNMCRLIHYLQKFRVIPVIGNGDKLQQPVFVGDVARAIVDCLSAECTIGKAYNIPGGNPLQFNEVIDTINRLLGRKVIKIHVPLNPVVSFLKYFEKHGVTFPIKSEQVLRLDEDKAFGFQEAERDFAYTPRKFEEGIALELEEMGMFHRTGRNRS